MRLYVHELHTPLGWLVFAVDGEGTLRCVDFMPANLRLEDYRVPGAEEQIVDPNRCSKVARQLAEYFKGRRRDFELPLDPGGTPFQQQVWSELRRIPYGATRSYGELARRIGAPRATRAVGRAGGANPIAIVIPCHRLIGADGSMVGYRPGIEQKRSLLVHEGAIAPGLL